MDETRKAENGDVKSTRDVLKKWNDYYINNDFGIGIQCDKCKKWREVFQYQDSSEVPEVWICSMWKMDGSRRGSCRIPSDINEDHFAEALYSPGSLVWAKMPGFPWWPAMIEDCPDVQHFCIPYVDSEHEYHVSFFGKKPLRNWIRASCIKDYSTPLPMTPKAKKNKDLQRSIEQANEALKMPPKERLKKYSFADRYKGHWAKVKELAKVDLPPNRLKRRGSEKPADFGPQLVAEEPHANQNCDRASAVKRVRTGKSKSEVTTKRKSVDNEGFQPVQQSIEPTRNGFPADSEKEENSEKEDSSEFRPQIKAEERHLNQDCHRKSTVKKVKNVKSKAATNRKYVVKEKFRPALESVEAISESSSYSEEEKNSEKQYSSQFRSQVMAKEPHFNQGYHSTLTVWEVRKAKSEAVPNRKSMDEEEFQPVLHSVGATRESLSGSEIEENNEEQDSSQSRSHVMAKEQHFNQDCPSPLTVWNVRNAKYKAVINRKSLHKEEFQPVQQSVEDTSESSSDSEKEENSEEQNSSEFRSQVMAKEHHFKQDCPSPLTVWNVRNAKSKAPTNRKSMDKEEFQRVKQPIKHKRRESDSSEVDSEEEENSTEFRSQIISGDYHRTSTVKKVSNVKSKSEDATKRKSVDKEEFQPVQQPIKHETIESDSEESSMGSTEASTDSEEEENSSVFRSQFMPEEPHVKQVCHLPSTFKKVTNVKSKSEDATKRKFVDDEEFQLVQQSNKHKRGEFPENSETEENSEVEDLPETRSPAEEPHVNQDCHRASTDWKVARESEDATKRKSIKPERSECPTDSEKEESEEDSSVLNNNTMLSDSEEEESPEVKAYSEFLNKKYPPLVFLADTNLLSVNGTGGNFSRRSSDSTVVYKSEDNFSENGSIISHENAAESLENDTVTPYGNAAECSENHSGANIVETDPSLLRTQCSSCSTPKNENFLSRSERFKKNRELMRELIDSNKSKYMPYSFYRGRMKK